jgi:hypothetical protein
VSGRPDVTASGLSKPSNGRSPMVAGSFAVRKRARGQSSRFRRRLIHSGRTSRLQTAEVRCRFRMSKRHAEVRTR